MQVFTILFEILINVGVPMTIFDMGYEVRYRPRRNGYAELSKLGQNPILEFHKVKLISISPHSKDKYKWFLREATLTDDVLNELLPSDWQIMKFRGFETVCELKKWLERR